MKVYNKKGKTAIADPEQIDIMLAAGWSLTKPEPEVIPEPLKKVVEEVEEVEEIKPIKITKPKKARKIVKK